MKACFSEGKLMKKFRTPLPKRTPFQLTSLSLSNFFMTPFFLRILKTVASYIVIFGTQDSNYCSKVTSQ